MPNERSSVVSLARAFRAVTALAIISTAAASNRPETKLLNVPLSFEPNQGQAASTVQFLSRGSGYALFLAPGQVVLNLERQQPASADTLRMSLIGANAKANPVGMSPQPGVVSYFIGNDPKNWRSGIPTYGKVEYPQIYPGVDLVFYGNQRQLEYDFVVAPGADPSRIAWRIDGARARVDAGGNLVLSAANGPASFKKPVLYQLDGDKKTSVEGSFAVAGNHVCFRLGDYDHSKALIIDPVLSYASYLAGSATDYIGNIMGPGVAQVGTSQGLALDSAGSVYVAGYTYSLNFPTKNPYASAPPAKQFGGSNVPPGDWPSAFVTKFSPDGSSLVYSTYLGGNNYDYIFAIAVDSSGSAYVTGQTNSASFPTTPGAYQKVFASNISAFVTKLNSTGTGLVYSTFLGGATNASATAIAVDSAGRAYIAGNETNPCTASSTQGCFPTTSGAVIGGGSTGGGSPQYAFVAAFDSTGAQLLYSTIFGDLNGFKCTNGCGGAYATGVAVDANGYFYLVGETQAGKLPTTVGVVQPSGAPLDSTGSYLPAWRGFVAKFNPVTSAGGVLLAYATYLGGHTSNLGDYISGIAIDSAGNAYVVGYTNSSDFPVTKGVYGSICGVNGTCAAAHVTKLNPTGTAIVWSTYVGGGKADGSDALFFTGPIQLDGKGNVYIMGQAGQTFPLINPVEPAGTGGAMELTVAELDPAGANLLFSTRIGSSGGAVNSNPAGLAVDSSGNIYLAGNTIGPGLITTPGAFQPTASSSTCCYHGFVAKIASTALPQINSGGVVNNASYGQSPSVAPGSIAALFGTKLTDGTSCLPPACNPTFSNGKLGTTMAGAEVTVDGTPVPIFYAAPTQLGIQIPFEATGTSATVSVSVAGQASTPATITLTPVSPGIFTATSDGKGAGAITHADGSAVTTQNPAQPGELVILYATGLGQVTPAVATGALPVGASSTVAPVTLTIGGINVGPQDFFAGLAGCCVGLNQINAHVPAGVSSGNAVPVVLTINGEASNTATIAVR
jgi:uncharacterized protein (TIGR03437 family)